MAVRFGHSDPIFLFWRRAVPLAEPAYSSVVADAGKRRTLGQQFPYSSRSLCARIICPDPACAWRTQLFGADGGVFPLNGHILPAVHQFSHL